MLSSPHIPAPIFTHDGDDEQTIFIIQKWCQHLPSLPIRFLVPFSDEAIKDKIQSRLPDAQIEFVKTSSGIKTTMDALLDHCQGAAWVLWLNSDRFITAALEVSQVRPVTDCLLKNELDVAAVKLTRWREVYELTGNEKQETIGNITFSYMAYTAFGFWQPHFIRTRLLQKIINHTVTKTADHPVSFNEAITRTLQSINEPVLFPNSSIIKTEEPIISGMTTINYEARRRREGLGPIKDTKSSRLIASFASPRSRSVNRYWTKTNHNINDIFSDVHPASPFHVVSYGGVGSTLFIRSLYHAIGITDVKQISKAHSHGRIPPTRIEPDQNLIYLFGDPRNALISFFQHREKRPNKNGFKENMTLAEPNEDWVIRVADTLQVDPKPMTQTWALETYLDESKDILRLEEHLDFWLYANAPYKIYFMRYETIWNYQQKITELFNIPSFKLPPKPERQANWKTLDPQNQVSMNHLYGEFSARIENMPDIFYTHQGKFYDVNSHEAMTFKKI